MDLSLSEPQQMIKDTVRRFMERECTVTRLRELDASETGFPSEIWSGLAELGLVGLGIPESYGGGGGSYTDLGVLYHELGRACAPTPHFSSAVLCAQILLEAGSEAQKSELLPAIAKGQRILALAITEPDFGWYPGQIQLSGTRKNGSFVLQGTKLFVPDAQVADQLIVAARTGSDPKQGISLFLVDTKAKGLGVRNLEGFVGGRLNEVSFEAVEIPAGALVGTLGSSFPVLDLVLTRNTPVLCAYMTGGCEWAFETTRDYARTREQFGAPIGTFQRVQDHLIEIVNEMDAARWTTQEALWKVDAKKDDWRTSVSLAKVVTSEAYHNVSYHAHEILAGAGSIKEHGMHFYTRAARTLYWYLGDPRFHRERLGQLLELQREER